MLASIEALRDAETGEPLSMDGKAVAAQAKGWFWGSTTEKSKWSEATQLVSTIAQEAPQPAEATKSNLMVVLHSLVDAIRKQLEPDTLSTVFLPPKKMFVLLVVTTFRLS